MTPQCCVLITEDAEIYRNADHFIMKCIGCKELDYPVISFRNTKVQDKLKGKTTGTISLKKGNTLKLKAVSGTGAGISYSSDRKSVASVSGSGVVTAKKKGSVIITVQSQKSKVTVKIRVTEKS